MENIKFVDNDAIEGREQNYVTIRVCVSEVLRSWRMSLYSFEWVTPEFEIKKLEELPEKEQKKREEVEERIRKGVPIEMPILGIGMLDNVEIGSGRAIFLTLAANGLDEMPVHVPAIYSSDFDDFVVNS